MKNRIMGELKKVFRPEFINRIDEVIVFHKLTKDEISSIVELLLKRIRESLAERELSLNLSEGADDLLVEKGWDPSMGARPLRRAIQRYIEDPLADEVLSQSMPPGSTVEVDRAPEEDERDVTITIVKPKERKRETVGVGAQGDAREEGSSTDPSSEGGDDLPDEPEVLPEIPTRPPPRASRLKANQLPDRELEPRPACSLARQAGRQGGPRSAPACRRAQRERELVVDRPQLGPAVVHGPGGWPARHVRVLEGGDQRVGHGLATAIATGRRWRKRTTQ